MNNKFNNLYLNLDKLIDFINLQDLQDEIAEIINVPMSIIDFRGNSITQPSNSSEILEKLKNLYISSFGRFTCNMGVDIQQNELKQGIISVIHRGVCFIRIPLIYNNLFLGSIRIGMVLIKDSNKLTNKRLAPNNNEIKELINEHIADLPVIDSTSLVTSMKMISLLANKILDLLIVSLKTKSNKSQEVSKQFYKQKKGSNVLRPAFDYINENSAEQIKLKQLASLCGVTPSYFSKLFKDVTGDNVINFINDIRIKKSKILLLTTDKSVAEIAEAVGFSGSGYFIRAFKNQEMITPKVFKKKNMS